ncbi:MAG: hypothetical protein C0467_20705 [Planctomycetaceae bacterium]|nr:hypothetical protein [Planctomycetaceae bacterium]
MATPDKIYIRDKKDGSIKNLEGNLVFTPTGIQIQAPDKKVLAIVAPADVVKVVPGEMAGVERGEVLKLVGLEDKKTKPDYAAARLGYLDMKKKAATAPEKTKRYLDFKIALMASRVADETGYDEDWSKVAVEAAKGWGDFVAEHKTGWEVWVASRAGARIYSELNKFDEVARIWNRMTKKEVNLPPDLLLEAQLQEIDAQIRTRTGAAAAQVAAGNLLKTAPAGPAKEKLAIYELAAKAMASGDPVTGVKPIEAAIAATKDNSTRGVGFSMIGELYKEAPRPRDAMWAFLWVETVYNADKEEAFKAMCRLAEVFKSQQDDDRVRAYQDKLRRGRGNF